MDSFESVLLLFRVVYLIVATIERVISNEHKFDKEDIKNIVEIILCIIDTIKSLPTLNMEVMVSYNSLTS
jgi:hypothetical protein